MTTLYIDTETCSTTDIRMGAYRYVEDLYFAVQITAWAVDDGPVQVAEGVPPEVERMLKDPSVTKIAHNAQFDRVALSRHLYDNQPCDDDLDWIEWAAWGYLDPSEWAQDTLARARCFGYPGKLKDLAKALGAEDKDEAGTRLIKKFACPPFADPAEHPEDWHAYKEYCRQDVATLRDIDHRLSRLPEPEVQVYVATERMNDRGIGVDAEAARLLETQYAETCEVNLERMREITGLENPNSQQQLTGWLSERLGYPVKSIAKQEVAALLEGDLQTDVREVLLLKQYNGLSTAKKFTAILDRVCEDGRLHGETQYMGAANTGRFSSRGTQLQNLSHDDQSVDRWEAMMLDVQMGEVLSADELRSMIRPLFRPVKSPVFIDDDYSQIEARLLAFLAGEETVLDHFRNGRDLYTETAREMGPSFSRKEGKVAVLACLPGSAEVLTDSGKKPLLQVGTQDRVWDGVEWVRHDGLVSRGRKGVLSYGGVTATHDHRVWSTLMEQPLPLESVAKLRAPLAASGAGGTPIRFVGDHRTRPAVARRVGGAVRPLPVSRVRVPDVGGSDQPRPGDLHSVLRLRQQDRRAQVAAQTVLGTVVEVREPSRPAVPELRGARNSVQVRQPLRRSRVHHVGARPRQVAADRPRGQRPWLRTRKPAVGHPTRKQPEQAVLRASVRLGVQAGGVALPEDEGRGAPTRWHVSAGYHRPGRAGRRGQAKELAWDRGQADVYDLLNCGPRSRFVADGALVHNCGYAGGANALKNFGGEAMVPEGEDVEAYLWGVVRAWRESHPKTVQLWDTLMDDFVSGTGWFEAPGPGVRALRLPSGRRLYYRDVRKGWDSRYDRPEYTCLDPKAPGKRRKVTKNTLSNNLVQATARDLMAGALVRADAWDLRPVVLVHDEMICETEDADRVQVAMETLPSWAEGLPLPAEPEVMRRWVKC